jgi:ferritin-like metal-binding protein YciE
MELESLQDLLLDELKDLLHAEGQILKALPKMAKKAKAPQLKQAFTKHLEVTKGHVERLKQVFEEMGEKPKTKKCLAMAGIVAEGQEMMGEDAEPEVRDAALIGSAQRVEHYEMAGYGTVAAWAKVIGNVKVAKLLNLTLAEEKDADQELTDLAEKLVNVEAK